MIVTGKGTMKCTKDGCTKSLEVDLVLLNGGGVAAWVPNDSGWHRGLAPSGAILCRCPDHPFSAKEGRPVGSVIQTPEQARAMMQQGLAAVNGRGRG